MTPENCVLGKAELGHTRPNVLDGGEIEARGYSTQHLHRPNNALRGDLNVSRFTCPTWRQTSQVDDQIALTGFMNWRLGRAVGVEKLLCW